MNKYPDKANKRFMFPSGYEIRVGGRISGPGAVWFEAMTLTVDETTTPPQTIVQGTIIDQATLYGLISRIRELDLTLISVKRLEDE